MSYFKKIMEKIEQDDRIPEEVWDKYVYTLESLPEKSVKAKKHNWSGKAAAAAVGVIAAGSLVCYTNPTLASKIPILGEIFKQVEKNVMYSGNYSDNAKTLMTEESTAPVKEEYYAEDAGVKVSASEVLYDGVSVFLTLKVEADEGNFLNIPKRYAGEDEPEGTSIMYLWGEYEVSGVTAPQALTEDSFYLEGKALDEKNFVGMVKMDPEKEKLTNGVLELTLTGIGYDDLEMLDSEDISASHKFEGCWKLQVPFEPDTEQTKSFTFDTKGKEYGLEKVTVSPYQIITKINVPYTEKEITREEFEAKMAEKTEGADDPGISYEEFVKQFGKTYADSFTLLFDQDGEQIDPRGGHGDGKSVFAVKGKDISKLQVLVFDDLNSWMELKASKLTDEAIEAAVNYEVVEIE